MLKIQFAICFLISLAAVLIAMPWFIRYMKRLSVRQTISEYSLEEDQKKAGTPIMGGILFILVPTAVTLMAAPALAFNPEMWILIISFLGYGLIGFIDDYLIAVRKNNDGLSPSAKFIMQLILAVVIFLLYQGHLDLGLHIPLLHVTLDLGWGYFLLIVIMFAAGSNAVNLTDGMDGLAAGCSIIAFLAFLVISLVQGKTDAALLITSLIGALLGYLYYNKKPARVFMGDTGSLSLGGLMAAVAMITKTEIAFIVIAGVFVIDTLTVIIQIASVKLRGKRVFLYTPIHFAFRIKGMPEVNVVRMFWAAEACFALLGLLIALA